MSKLQHLFRKLWKKIFATKKRKIAKPRKLCGTFDHDKKNLIKEKQIPDYCQFQGCNERLSMFNMKQCKYCGNYFCIDHTAPSEKHGCRGTIIPKIIYRSSRRKD